MLSTSDSNRTLGFAGSVALAVGGLAAGALPTRDPFGHIPGIRELRALPLIAIATTFLGLALLLGAWLRSRRAAASPRELTVTLLWWMAPLAIAPPMFSRDVYSYLAQGAMVRRGIDPYVYGPSALASRIAADVPDIWQNTPAPYGPVFLRLAAAIVGVTGERSVTGVLGLRALAIVSVLVIARCVPALARSCGVDPGKALWLGVLNPLVLIHLVSGAHNDALMIALMLAGVVVALRGYILGGIVLVAAGALVKVPAVVALACIAPIWAARWPASSRYKLVVTAGLTAFVGAAALGGFTLALDLGTGWISTLSTPTTVHNGLSVSTDAGIVLGHLGQALGLTTVDTAVTVLRTASGALGAAVACAALLWWRGNPGLALGAGLLAFVLCGPIVHPWYVLWGLIPFAAGAADQRLARRFVIALTIPLTVFLMPYGMGPTAATVAAGAVGVGAGWYYLRLRPAMFGELPDGQVLEGEPVPVDAESGDHAGRHRGDHRVVPELLPRVNV
jgi:hypothetical protein